MEILRNDSKAASIFGVAFAYDAKKFPEFKLANLSGDFPAANLLIKRVEELLSSCCACIRRAVMQGATKTSEIQQPFWRSVEHHTHTVKQIDDAWCRITHVFHERLVCEKVSAVAGVIEVNGRRVAFALGVHSTVDAALCTD